METIKEIWVDSHVGIKDFYQISSIGRVKSLSRLVKRGAGYEVTTEKIMNIRKDKLGYMFVGLYVGTKKQVFKKVHRLVAESFIPNPLGKKCVNHINGIKTDNRIENLEWATHAENTRHAITNGLFTQKKGEDRHDAKLREKDVLQIRELASTHTHVEIAKLFKVSRRNIGCIINRESWKHI